MKLSKIITVENIALILECKTDYFIGITDIYINITTAILQFLVSESILL